MLSNEVMQKEAIKYIKRQKQINLNWLNRFRKKSDVKENDIKEIENNFLKQDKMFDYILTKIGGMQNDK